MSCKRGHPIQFNLEHVMDIITYLNETQIGFRRIEWFLPWSTSTSPVRASRYVGEKEGKRRKEERKKRQCSLLVRHGWASDTSRFSFPAFALFNCALSTGPLSPR